MAWNARTVRAAAKRLNIVITVEGERHSQSVSALAPKGFIFGESGVHCERASTEDGNNPWLLIGDQIEWGLVPCGCAECAA